MSKILPHVQHDLSNCLQSKNARCNLCATWHNDNDGMECPFRLVVCHNKIHEKKNIASKVRISKM